MSAEAYQRVIDASTQDRTDLFLGAAQRLGTPLGNIEKDFWVCWTLDALYHRLPSGGPRLLFKGGTSLSKAYGLIERFSEDIDVTVYRNDLGEAASVEQLEALTGKKRQAKLDAIRDACRTYVTGPLHEALTALLADATSGAGRISVDEADPEGQTLLVFYPTVLGADGEDLVPAQVPAYVRPVVRIESGAKSALDPNRAVTLRPYVADELPTLDLTVPAVTTIEPGRTLWDKVVIAHGLRRWFERRGALRQEGQRISRHYYDLHCLLHSDVGRSALTDAALGAECVRHARIFFNRPDYDLASASRGSYALRPVAGMTDALERDYGAMVGMIFGTPPAFAHILESIRAIEAAVNAT